MAKIEKHFGVTIPFDQGGITGYAKTYTGLEISLDKPVLSQIEDMLKLNNVLDDLLIDITDAKLRRAQAEYSTDGVLDDGATQVDTVKLLAKLRDVLKANNIE